MVMYSALFLFPVLLYDSLILFIHTIILALLAVQL